jgi:hypothetical protein
MSDPRFCVHGVHWSDHCVACGIWRTYPKPVNSKPVEDDITCEHGTALDVHCCNCHSGFLFDTRSCTCVTVKR